MSMNQKLILATSNVGKINELTDLLKPIVCIPQATLNISDAEESGISFVENALIKARHAATQGSCAALADDSGLVVDVLKGEPGIYSARFATLHHSTLDNISYLLERLTDVPMPARRAYFYCALVLLQHAADPTPLIVTGKWPGYIAMQTAGEGGFGYDPIFYVPEFQCTAAQLTPAQKNKMSHRGQAMRALKAALTDSINEA